MRNDPFDVVERYRERAKLKLVAPANVVKPDVRGITVSDVLRVFSGARIVSPEAGMMVTPGSQTCAHCNGKIVQRIWRSGKFDFGCHYCGRARKILDSYEEN